MSDPLDLEALKERQADRRNELGVGRTGIPPDRVEWWGAEADLDRAIEIAEEAQALLTRLRQEWSEVGDGCLIVKHYDGCKGCQLLDDVIGEDR